MDLTQLFQAAGHYNESHFATKLNMERRDFECSSGAMASLLNHNVADGAAISEIRNGDRPRQPIQ